jgi:hypothetical protein
MPRTPRKTRNPVKRFKTNPAPILRGCHVCGEPTEVSLTVQGRGAGQHRGENASQTRSFCAEHGRQVWDALQGTLVPPSEREDA